jgi:branched-chain amino acid transport system permease protein
VQALLDTLTAFLSAAGAEAGKVARAVVEHYASFTPRFLLDLFTDYGIFLVICLGYYLLMIGGQVSLGHAGMVGISSYASAVFVVKFGLPFWIALPLCGLVGILSGVIYAGLFALRLGGFYLAIGTFAFGEMLVSIWLNLDYLGGAVGFVGIPLDSTSGVVLAAACIALFSVWRIEGSYFGKAFRAIRDNETVAGAMGINVRRMKIINWMAAGCLTGIGGSLYAHRVTVLQPADFSIYFSILIVLAALLGGLRSFWGTVLGAAIVSFMPWLITTGDPRDRLMLYGLVIVALMVFRPDGLIGTGRRPVSRVAAVTDGPVMPAGAVAEDKPSR